MRTIPANALTEIAKLKGIEPINVLEVYWNVGNVITYSDKDIPGSNIQGKILSISNLDEIINIQRSGTTVSINVTLDDCDDTIRQIMNSFDIHKRPCILYQYFQGLSYDDKFAIFKGQIATPIVWSEGERTISFDILSKVNSIEVGFAPEEGQFPSIPPDLVGKVWPLCFGSVVHVPATRSNETLTGSTLSLFGLADVTLDIKRKLLEIGIQSLRNTYDFYNLLIDNATLLVDSATILQGTYADAIIIEDQNKQAREDLIELVEDLDAQLKGLIDQYEADAGLEENIPLLARIDAVRKTRDIYLEGLKSVTAGLNNIEFSKKLIERDYKYAKYVFNVIGKLRGKTSKLLEDYHEIQEQLKTLDIIKTDQIALIRQSVLVTNGYQFPQNQNIYIDIKDQTFIGNFTGNKFNFVAAAPTYTNISIGTKRDTENNTFFITDQSIKLANKYCLLHDGTIIKVTSQDGLKCTFELRPKFDNLSFKKNDIAGTASNISSARQGLSSILAGHETDEEVITIMNQLPKDISIGLWKRLLGGPANQQVIKMVNGPIGGTFDMYYGEFKIPNTTKEDAEGEEYSGIPYNAKKEDIKAALLRVPEIVGKIKDINTDLVVTGDQLPTNEITITFGNNLLPMQNIRCDGNDLEGSPNSQKLMTVNNPTSGSFKLKVGTEKTGEIKFNASAEQVQNALEKLVVYKVGDIICSGGPLDGTPNGVITITTGLKDPPVITLINVKLDKGNVILTGHIQTKVPLVTCYVKSPNGAHEYTVKQINKLIEDAIGNTQYKKGLEETKEKLGNLYKQIVDEDMADKKETFKEIIKYIKVYKDIMKSVQIPQSTLAEAYRNISDKEYDVLFNFEVLNYMNWVRSLTPIQAQIPDDSDKYYVTGHDIIHIKEASSVILPQWVNTITLKDSTNIEMIEEFVNKAQRLPTSQAFVASVGSKVVLQGQYQEKFVANILPSTVHAVYAYRSIDGTRQLVPVPSRYYSKNEAEPFGAITATTISLVKPLTDYALEFWENDIYVTLTSSVGPNTASIISWIANNFTNLTPDATSFADVSTKLTNYPSSFALFKKIDAIQLMQEIAWQARCTIWSKFDTLYIKYLSEEPTSIDTITEADIEEKSLELTCTDTMDLVTKFTALWRPSYDIQEPYKIVLRSNVKKYDEISEEHDFYIYNIHSLVMKSATFWMIQKANTFKRVNFKTFLHKLKLEAHDCVTLNLANDLICTGSTKAIIEKADYDSATNTITLTCWLPILFGQMTRFDFAWPAGISINLLFPTNEVILSGNAGNPFGDKIPTGLPFDPTDAALIGVRPQNYGDLIPSDSNDSLPQNPANEFTELDYSKYDIENFEPTVPQGYADRTKNEENAPEEDGGEQVKNKAVSQALGEEFSSVCLGVVASFHSEDIVPSGNGDLAIVTTKQYYNVRLSDGRVVKVRQLQIHPDDRVPSGSAVYVVFNKEKNEHEMQAPIWLGEEDALA